MSIFDKRTFHSCKWANSLSICKWVFTCYIYTWPIKGIRIWTNWRSVCQKDECMSDFLSNMSGMSQAVRGGFRPPPLFFCRKFNPISTRGQSMPTTVLRVPRFSNLATVLYIKVNIYHQWNPKCGYTLFANFWKSWGVTISCRNQSYEIKSPPYYIALFHHTVDGCTMAIKVYILVLSIEK